MPTSDRSNRKERIGIVVSDKMDKTIAVRVGRVINHSVYDKQVRTATIFKAHDETNSAKTGDTVRIVETRPLSKTKRWRLVEIIKRASVEEAKPTAGAADVEPQKQASEKPER